MLKKAFKAMLHTPNLAPQNSAAILIWMKKILAARNLPADIKAAAKVHPAVVATVGATQYDFIHHSEVSEAPVLWLACSTPQAWRTHFYSDSQVSPPSEEHNIRAGKYHVSYSWHYQNR